MRLQPISSNEADYLRVTDVLDWTEPAVQTLARSLGEETGNRLETARRCFEWVRDHIRHSVDFQMNPVTCSASEALRAGTGFCYAKSHLLVALLRANGIPGGLCYQRLVLDSEGKSLGLHGLVAVHLEEIGWYRCDPRGNKQSIEAAFEPPIERLAFALNRPGECDYPEVWPDPLPDVVSVLRRFSDWREVLENLPDRPPQAIAPFSF